MMTPRTSENVKFYNFKRQSRFSIRKFTIGVASVSLGTAFVATAPAASAETLETASSELVASSADLASQVADKTALAKALSEAQAIDLSQQSPEVAEGFVELFARATALLEQTDAEQAELDALTQELQQVTVALTTELPTAVATPVEVVEADELKLEVEVDSSVSNGILEEVPIQFSQQTTTEKVEQLIASGSIPKRQFIDAGFAPGEYLRTNNLITSIDVAPNLADIFAPLYPEGTRFEWFGEYDIDVDASMPAITTGNFSRPYTRNNLIESVRYVAILPDGTRLGRLFHLAQVIEGKALEVNLNEEPDAKKMLRDSGAFNVRLVPGTSAEAYADSLTYEWRIKPDTRTPGHKTGVFAVKSANGTVSEYWVTVTVVDNRKASDIHVPIVAEQRVPIGATIDPRSVLSNLNELPATIGVEWVTEPVTTLAQWEQNRGLTPQTYDLKVTYPDGSFDIAQVPVRIWAQANEHANNIFILTSITTTIGVLPEASTLVPKSAMDKLPVGTTVRWGSAPDVSGTIYPRPGRPMYEHQSASIVYTFPDGSGLGAGSRPFYVTYVDNATYFTPIATVQEVDFGATVDPALSIANRDTLIQGTRFEWLAAPDTTQSGQKEATVSVLYPDGSKDEVAVTITVRVSDNNRPSQAEVYKPTAVLGGLTLGINDPIDPAQLIANRSDLPSDARFEFVEPVGEALSGTSKIVSVRIVFSDGSVRTVRSRLTFRLAQAQEYIPEAQSIRVGLGALIRPIDFIKNASSLPADTRYSWAQEPSTRVPGGKVGQIIVTYPDGSTDKITVRFTVR